MSFFNESVYKATKLTKDKRNKLFKKLQLSKFKEEAILKRKMSLGNADSLWLKAKVNFEKAGIKVEFAENGQKVKEIIEKKLNKEKLIVKGKSLTTEEIRLRQFLENKGIETVETDLGEWIIQLNNQLPSHFTAPAVHLSKEEVAKIINEKTNSKLSPDPEEITKYVRKYLREKFKKANVGIIGANFVIADPSVIMCVSNEGNISLSSRLPKKIFAIVGYDRIYNDNKGMENLQKLLTVSATGQLYTSYIDFIKKPLPHQEITLIVLDNGRKKLMKSEFRDVARCIRCASCLNSCPIYSEVGGHVFGEVYHGGIGSLLTEFTGDKKIAEKIANYCSRCSTCEEYCPMDIKISELVSKLSKKHQLPFYLKFPLKMMKETKFKKKTDKKNVLFIGCAFRSPILKQETNKIKENAIKYFKDEGGIEIIEEGCCGMPHFYKGELEESEIRKFKLLKVFEEYENVYIPCSSGYSFLKKELGEKLKLLSLEYLEQIEIQENNYENIYYHLPCHFKNEKGRNEISKLREKVKLKEWEQEQCCGSAGTYFISHPIISKKVLKRKEVEEASFKIITSCPSCIIQLRRIFGIKNVIHTANFLKK